MATGSSVHKATLADAPRLAQALASAFQDDPVIAWIFPDKHRRRRVLRAFMEFRLRKLAFPYDQVRTASVMGGLERMEQRHPHDPPHWYLFILGAEPTAQRRGLSSALLDHMLARVDADGMPAYLESSSERNLALYGRHGFEVTGEVAIPGGPRIWPMWREPALEQVITRRVRPAVAARWRTRPPGSTRPGWSSDDTRTAGSPTVAGLGCRRRRHGRPERRHLRGRRLDSVRGMGSERHRPGHRLRDRGGRRHLPPARLPADDAV